MKIQVTNETGREVNPYKELSVIPNERKPLNIEFKFNNAWKDFEQSVQSFPAPGFKDTAPGEWVEAELVWQFQDNKGEWLMASKDVGDYTF